MTKIRVITPIISAGFRDDGPLLEVTPKGCELSSVFLTNGPASVETAIDEVLAAPGVVDSAIAAEAAGMRGIVVDCMLDPGLDAAREAVAIPVIGCGEAGISAAAQFGKFSVVTVLDRQARAFRDLAARHGLSGALASVRGIGVTVLDLEKDRAGSIAATIQECRRALAEDGADSIIFGCTGMLGFAQPVARELGISTDRIIDPLPYAINLAYDLVTAGKMTDKSVYPAPDPKKIEGFAAWRHLNQKLEGKT